MRNRFIKLKLNKEVKSVWERQLSVKQLLRKKRVGSNPTASTGCVCLKLLWKMSIVIRDYFDYGSVAGLKDSAQIIEPGCLLSYLKQIY